MTKLAKILKRLKLKQTIVKLAQALPEPTVPPAIMSSIKAPPKPVPSTSIGSDIKALPKLSIPNPNATGTIPKGLYDPNIVSKVNRYSRGIQSAETKGQPDPWIRTKVSPDGGSTAYGPYQLTVTKSRDYMNRYGKYFTPEEHTWHSELFEPQGNQFLRYGKNTKAKGYLPRYDYGGKGFIGDSESSRAMYNSVAKKMMAIDLAESKGNIMKALTRWRGKPVNEQSPYYTRYIEGYNN